MKDVLKDIRYKLENHLYQCEEHVRLSLVARILSELGWDIWNPLEVNSEYKPVPSEDATKVDIALFQTKYIPTAYIEIKQHGKLEKEISRIEKQLRDYCRDNTALFAIMTDGEKWRFYYSQTGGEFSQKCFKVLDIRNDDLDELCESFQLFLSKESIESGKAKKEAEDYLQLNQKQRAIEDAIPIAKKTVQEPPFPRLTEAIVQIVAQSGITISESEAESYLMDNSSRIKAQPQDSDKSKTAEKSNNGSKERSLLNIDLQPPDFAKKDPINVFVIDEWYPAKTWQQVKEFTYKVILDKLISANLPKTCQVSRDPSYFPRNPKKIGNTGYYYDGNHGSVAIVHQCRKAMEKAGFNPDTQWGYELKPE
jgi:hypothetical protein